MGTPEPGFLVPWDGHATARLGSREVSGLAQSELVRAGRALSSVDENGCICHMSSRATPDCPSSKPIWTEGAPLDSGRLHLFMGAYLIRQSAKENRPAFAPGRLSHKVEGKRVQLSMGEGPPQALPITLA
jgi:hypothetical protein